MLRHFQSLSSPVRRRQRRGGPPRGGIPLPPTPSRHHNSEASDDEGSCFWRCHLVTKTNNNNNKKFRRGIGRHRDQTIMMLKMLIMLLILVSIFIIITGLATPQPTTMKLGHAVVGTTTTPIYWINLDKSKDRMEWMSNMFSSLGLTNTHRVAAHAINSTWRSWMYGTLVFHPLIKLVPRTAESNHGRDHTHLKYYYEEAACTLSHLEAIKQAYEDGNELALILEDDAQLSTEFFDSLPSVLQSAPSGWKVLQFSCSNPHVVAHGSNLLDPFISWQPYHWSMGAYVVNRAGMKSLLDKLYSKSFFLRHDTWRIEQHPFVVADEVIYATIGDAYTSTKLRVGARKMKSTVQDLARDSGAMTTIDGSLSISLDLLSPSILDESLLVLMSVRIWAAEYIETELRRIQQDSNSVCKLYKRCKWGVNVVLTTDALRESFDEALFSDKFQQASKDGAGAEFHFEVSVSEQRFNKYVFVSQFVMEMANFDLVLLKDADMGLTGFPWRTFIARKGSAVVSAPLRQSFGSSSVMQSYIEDTQSRHFLYHEAILWLGGSGTKWSRELFANIQPVKVPILEQSFALFDGRFASHFFGQVLTEEYVHQRSDYWLDYLWCQVAFGWDEARPGCRLVPVAIVHHNTRQLTENASAGSSSIKEEGFAIRHSFSDHPTFGRLMELSGEWSKLVGNQNLQMIEERCSSSHFMDSSNDNDDQEEEDDGDGDGGTPQPFNLEACSELFINHNQ